MMALIGLLPLLAVVGASPRETASVTRRHFEGPPEVRRSEHFVLLHNSSKRSADNTLRLLRLTHHTFYAAMGEAGFKLDPLNRPLMCLVFANKEPFVSYARAADHRNMSWSGGYYSARTNRVALYERPAHQAARIVAEPEKRQQAAGLTAPNGDRTLGSDADVAASLAPTTHEAAHQLAFNSGLQRRGVMYPFWLNEGLAVTFEINARQTLGPAAANPRRKRSLLQARSDEKLIPLRRFVAMTRINTADDGAVSRRYAQAWGLFRYLFLNRTDALQTYMARLGNALPGPRRGPELREAFTAAFGPVPAVEKDWRRWLGSLQ